MRGIARPSIEQSSEGHLTRLYATEGPTLAHSVNQTLLQLPRAHTGAVAPMLAKLKAAISKKPKEKIPFPPPSWFEDGHVVNPGTASPYPEKPRENPPPDGNEDGADEPGNDDDEPSPPPASWIAQKIQDLIEAFPPPASKPTEPSHDGPSTQPGSEPGDAHPQPPPIDSKLKHLLSTAYIMNGSISRGRHSVWKALEALGPPPHGLHARRDQQEEVEDGDDECSLMLYTPIMPTPNDHVEVASCHSVAVAMETNRESGAAKASGWPWPFGRWGSPTGSQTGNGGQGPAAPSKPTAKAKLVWEPSSTQLSVEVMWWGYRL